MAKFGFNLQADRFISWEAQIKDVCSACNNELLSKVDVYAKRFFIENRIDRLITDEKRIEIGSRKRCQEPLSELMGIH